jgi:hypothetical protein
MAMQKSQAANDYDRFASAFQTLKLKHTRMTLRGFKPDLPIEAEPGSFLGQGVFERMPARKE